MGISIHAAFKRKFFAGLLISIPVIITFPVIGWFSRCVVGLLDPVNFKIPGSHTPWLRIILSGGMATPPKISGAKG
jgi:hypothetical protein